MSLSCTPYLRAALIAALLVGGGLGTVASADDTPATPPARDGSKSRDRNSTNPPKAPREGLRGGGGANDRPADRSRGDGRGGRRADNKQLINIFNSLKLTEDQKSQMDQIVAEFEKAQAEFEANEQPKLRAIQEKRDAERKATGKISEETNREMKEVLSKRPRQEAVVGKLLALLTPEQKAEFKERREALEEGKRPGGDPRDRSRTRGADRGNAGGQERSRERGTNGSGRGSGDGPKRGTPPARDRKPAGDGTNPPKGE